jgi:hypothetical protein
MDKYSDLTSNISLDDYYKNRGLLDFLYQKEVVDLLKQILYNLQGNSNKVESVKIDRRKKQYKEV